MTFNWVNRKQIFNIVDYPSYNLTHAQVPYYFNLEGEEFIFFTSRPPQQKDGSYVSQVHNLKLKVDVDLSTNILKFNGNRLIDLGELGCFDETGTMPCSVVYNKERDEIWLYYVGWNRKLTVPYDCAVGLAISKDGGRSFQKISKGPILGQNIHDPFLVGCPRVSIFNGKWYMFYLSGCEWVLFGDKKESHYRIKMATSADGLHWQTNLNYLIPEKYELESQTCPSVFFHEGKYHMFFTYRHTVDFRNPERGYRIGYASSDDLMSWTRDDEAGNFSTGKDEWDNEMVCYPNVNIINGKLVMFYCGNSFGRFGFGMAQNL